MIPQAIQHSQNKEIIIKRRGSCETAHLERVTPFGKRHFSRDLIMNGNWPEKGGRRTGTADAEAWKGLAPRAARPAADFGRAEIDHICAAAKISGFAC